MPKRWTRAASVSGGSKLRSSPLMMIFISYDLRKGVGLGASGVNAEKVDLRTSAPYRRTHWQAVAAGLRARPNTRRQLFRRLPSMLSRKFVEKLWQLSRNRVTQG
jgi:hypothetical protein